MVRLNDLTIHRTIYRLYDRQIYWLIDLLIYWLGSICLTTMYNKGYLLSMANLCSNEHSKMSFELLETIQVTQSKLPPKLASGILKGLGTYEHTFEEKAYICAMKILKVWQPIQNSRNTSGWWTLFIKPEKSLSLRLTRSGCRRKCARGYPCLAQPSIVTESPLRKSLACILTATGIMATVLHWE